ncbi:MAG: hypothetical protein IT548_13735 [Alphaproteobacteria bacterium]|nr:hypothetical protein [Alphaproteobacteria bacterium]
MSKHIHFELFVRRGAARSWSLHDAIESRQDALDAAKAQMASGFVTAVRVVKEVFDDATNEFRSVVILEDGNLKKIALGREEEDKPAALPCLTPEDLYSVHARLTLSRLFADTLARWKLTVTELIHRPDMLEKLEATGTLFQHAVQKVAIAQTASNGVPVPQIIRAVNDLADRAIQRVYREDRAGRITACASAAELAALADARGGQPDAAFALGLALARYLAPAPNWSGKLDLVLQAIAALPKTEAARAALLTLADAVVGEILSGSAALQELIGPMPDLGSALVVMSDLYLGRPPGGEQSSALARLSSLFGADQLLDARTGLGRRILAELRAHKKLAGTVDAEMRHLRAITHRLVQGPPKLVPHEDIVAAITVRSRRLVQSDTISELLKDAKSPIDKAERLLSLDENVVGAENKRRIWDYLKPILSAAPFEAALLDPRLPPLERLALAARLQTRILRSSLAEASRGEGASAIDAIARHTIDQFRTQLTAADRTRSAVVALTFARALESGGVPKGTCETAIREVLRKLAA